MSVVLNGSSQFLYYHNISISLVTYPFTISIWFKPDNITATFTAARVGAHGYNTQNIAQCRGSVAGDYVAAATFQDGVSGWALAYSSSGYSASTWQHLMVVFNSSTDRRVYLDGGSKGTDSTNRNGANHALDTFMVGARDSYSSPTGFFDGKLAEFVIWDMALSDANAASLAGGTNPLLIEYGNIIQYNVLNDDATASVGQTLTEVASPTWDDADNPTIGAPYIDAAVTISGTGGFSFSGEVKTFIDAALAVSGTGGFNLVPNATQTNRSFKRRLVLAGSNVVYYE